MTPKGECVQFLASSLKEVSWSKAYKGCDLEYKAQSIGHHQKVHNDVMSLPGKAHLLDKMFATRKAKCELHKKASIDTELA